MTPQPDEGLCALAEAIARGERSVVQVVRACIERIEALEPEIHAFVDFRPEAALRQALAADRSGGSQPPLHGIPVAVKEVFDVAGMRCSWGTAIHAARVPQRDAAIVSRLRALGAVVMGTTVSTEYAIAAAGPTVNPHDHSRTPGGSSSGSAAAVAAGMVPLALGSQSIGSVVRPATYCGVWGLKPSKGLLPTEGGMVLSEHLDHVGLLSGRLEDLQYVWQALAVASPAPPERAPSLRLLSASGPLVHRIGPESDIALDRARRAASAAGIPIENRALPASFEQVEQHTFTILCHDMARHHGEDRRRFGAQMSERLRELIDRGATISDREYSAAIAQADVYRQDLLRALDAPGTLMLAAATDGVAPPREQGTGSPLLQAIWTLTGLPVLAVPCGLVHGLPVGVQLIAAPGREALLFQVGLALAGFDPGTDGVRP